MKHLVHITLVAVLFLQGNALANNEAKKEAENLLNTMGMDSAFERSIEAMLDLQLKQNPNLKPYKHVMLKFFRKHMSFERMKPDMIIIYSEAFTAKELREINAFYKTSTGRKTIRMMPELLHKGGLLGARRVQDNMHELQQMIQAESERIKRLQNSNAPLAY